MPAARHFCRSPGAAPAVTGVKDVIGSGQNDTPTATNLSAAESYTEDPPLTLTPIVVSDVDSATVTVTLTLSDPLSVGIVTVTAKSLGVSQTASSFCVSTSSRMQKSPHALLPAMRMETEK